MSNSKLLEQYKELCSELVLKIAELHNRNMDYVSGPSKKNGEDTRRLLREIEDLADRAKKTNLELYTNLLKAKRAKWGRTKGIQPELRDDEE